MSAAVMGTLSVSMEWNKCLTGPIMHILPSALLPLILVHQSAKRKIDITVTLPSKCDTRKSGRERSVELSSKTIAHCY